MRMMKNVTQMMVIFVVAATCSQQGQCRTLKARRERKHRLGRRKHKARHKSPLPPFTPTMSPTMMPALAPDIFSPTFTPAPTFVALTMGSPWLSTDQHLELKKPWNGHPTKTRLVNAGVKGDLLNIVENQIQIMRKCETVDCIRRCRTLLEEVATSALHEGMIPKGTMYVIKSITLNESIKMKRKITRKARNERKQARSNGNKT